MARAKPAGIGFGARAPLALSISSTAGAAMQAGQIETYLRSKFNLTEGVRVSGLSRFSVGASRETWAFDASWPEDGELVAHPLVLRRDTEAGPVETDLQHEFRVYAALQGTAIPVPRSYWYEADPQWFERPFFLMGRVDGCESSPQTLLGDVSYASARSGLGERFVELIAKLHQLDWEASRFASFLARPPLDRVAEGEVDLWEEVLDRNQLEPQPLLRGMIQWLREHLPPPPARLVVVHGDMRVGNFLATQSGEIAAMLDWELTHLGDPLEDVSWAMHPTFAFGVAGRVGGIIERSRYLQRYEELTGTPTPGEAIRFWEVLSGVKLAVILLTGGRAFVDGRSHTMTSLMLGRGAIRNALLSLDAMGMGAGS